MVALSSADVALIAERFEMGGFVHFQDFLLYFRSEDPTRSGASPFLLTAEWDKLKSSKPLSLSNVPASH
jgi:hypothetical protein